MDLYSVVPKAATQTFLGFVTREEERVTSQERLRGRLSQAQLPRVWQIVNWSASNQLGFLEFQLYLITLFFFSYLECFQLAQQR